MYLLHKVTRDWYRLLAILRSFDAFSIFDNLVSWKWLIVEQNGHKFWVRGVHGICVTVKCSRSFVGHSVHFCFFPISTALYLETAGRRAASGCIILTVYRVLVTVKCSRSFWGHSVYFQFSTALYFENVWSWNKADQNLCLGGKYLMSKEDVWVLNGFD